MERARGGIGSFVRVEWMRRYHKERAKAAALDREKVFLSISENSRLSTASDWME